MGWINFDPNDGGVTIDPTTGDFSGYAWGENIGWLKFAGEDQNSTAYKVKLADTAPSVTTQAVTGIGRTSATGNGNITNLGSSNPTAHGVCWATTADPTTANTCTDKGAATTTGAFTAGITGLSAGTTYHVRAFATNNAGTVYGENVAFTTSSPSPPPPTPINGQCGSADGQTYTSAPTSGLCSRGTASAVSGDGPWTWNCQGRNGGSNASCSAGIQSYTVIGTAGAGGSVSPTTRTVNHGSTTTFTVTPDTGYAIASVTGCGGNLAGNTYTTGAITGACAVNAVFSLNSYAVTGTAGAGGSISPIIRTVNHGSTTTLTVTPNTGYAIASVTGCGGSLSGNTYITGMITGNCSVAASFSLQQAENVVTVLAEPAEGGAVLGGDAYAANQNVTVKAIPNTGWVFQYWSENGVEISRMASYKFTVTRNHTLKAHFRPVVALPGVLMLLLE